MRRTLTAKQERFCLLIVKGEVQSKAYELAGYAASNRQIAEVAASRLLSSVKVKARVAELQRNVAIRAEITVENMTAEAMRLMRKSEELEQMAAANGALALVARLNGLLVDHKTVDVVHHKPSPIPTKQLELSESEWRRQFEKK